MACEPGCLLAHKQQITSRMAAINRRALELAGRQVNLSSPAQLAQLLYQELQLPVPANLGECIWALCDVGADCRASRPVTSPPPRAVMITTLQMACACIRSDTCKHPLRVTAGMGISHGCTYTPVRP